MSNKIIMRRHKRMKADTYRLFSKYEAAILKRSGILKDEWDRIKKLIVQMFGPYDDTRTYCGPGRWGDKVVPDFIFKFAGYVHDGFYFLIEKGILAALRFKKIADKIFYIIMELTAPNWKWKALAKVYFYAVHWFGNPKFNPN